MASFHVWSKGCVAPIHVRSKFADFAPHMGEHWRFALHKEGSNAHFAPRMERRHSFSDKKIAKIFHPPGCCEESVYSWEGGDIGPATTVGGVGLPWEGLLAHIPAGGHM